MRTTIAFIAALCALTGACAATTDGSPFGELDTIKAEEGKTDASAEAVFLEFEFDGELLTDSSWNATREIENQLLYTVGQLNGERSVGRLDKLELSDVRTSSAGGRTRVTYHARMPVAWGRRANVPTEYAFRIPRDVAYSALEQFTTKYQTTCVDSSAHDVDANIMWYYYRPKAYRCRIDDADVVTITASVSPSPIQTTGKFPEYDEVWEDDALRVVAVFGKYEDGATASTDAGIAAYNRFVRLMKTELAGTSLVTLPATIPSDPGVAVPDVTFTTTIDGGKTIEVVALLVDNVRTAGAAFDARYRSLTPTADLIAYNGHSGLGANIRALARKGRWVRGQYAMIFMNGCDTYAYVDSALWDAHAAVNPDDPEGTKYLDIVMNAMPSFFHSTANATTTLIRALRAHESPLTYEQIFAQIDRSQVVLVSGEEDNDFVPGGGGGGGEEWAGIDESGSVAARAEKRYETPALAPGRYVFDMTGSGGDADLYVRVGLAPTTTAYDCRPYLGSSNESCAVELTSAAPIHVMVRGYSGTPSFRLVGRPE